MRYGPPAVSDAFCAARLASDSGLEYGTLPAGTDFETIIARGRAHIAAARSTLPSSVRPPHAAGLTLK